MRARWTRQATFVGCSALVVVALATSCSRSPLSPTGVNLAPQIEIVDARAFEAGADAIRVRWSARDPDGTVSEIRWTTGPVGGGGSAPTRLAGRERECLIPVATHSALAGQPSTREPELLTLWAVDDAGAASEPARLAYFAQNIAPYVTITSPQPSPFIRPTAGPTICISWWGTDPDGVFTNRPVKYKYELLTEGSEPPIQTWLVNPDSLRRYAVANNWAGWDSTSADTTFVRLENLVLNQSYLFVVTAFDEAGDYDPVFSLSKNMLYFQVGFPEVLGPRLTLQAPGLLHAYPSGGAYDDPTLALKCEVASGAPLSVELGALPAIGQQVTGFRWVLDPVDPLDETPRSGPEDVHHWSEWSLSPEVDLGVQGSASFKRAQHRLYFQGRSGFAGCNDPADDFVSRGLLEFVVVRATLSREILIVDDMRLEPDRLNASGCLLNYTQAWPSATELDTFLYARGGVPWRCTINPTTGVISTPGLFAGFSYDTLGTRGLRSGYAQSTGGPLQQVGSVPLSKLADYRHVIWLTDRSAALSTQPYDGAVNPMSTLRHWSQGQLPNVLTTYAEMGGKVWLVGSTATASSLPWDRVQNNSTVVRFSSAAQFGELAPGRIPWDLAHLRSEVTAGNAALTSRTLGRFESAPGVYAALPVTLDNRTTAFDPLPPTRTVVSHFNVSTRAVEAISQPNFIVEDVDPDPGVVNEVSVVDSIYSVSGGSLPGEPMPAMVLYHGGEHGQVLWSGFEFWTFKRADAAAIVNWVLQDLWGLTPSRPANAPASVENAPSSGVARAARRITRTTVR